MAAPRALVTGAGGFIGHHLVAVLKRHGYWVRGVDLEPPAYGHDESDEFHRLDLRQAENAARAADRIDEVFALAADMGGMGFISTHDARLLRNNILINVNTLEGARAAGVRRYLFTSSACVYPGYRQREAAIAPLREEEAYPAEPDDGYGWEKLFTERLCRAYAEDAGAAVRIVRLHNIFGPRGTWRGGREKAPAAICRKVAIAKLTGDLEVEVWGDGAQTRSFCYVDDCTEGLLRLMRSDYEEPLNLGQDRLVTIDELVDMVADIAGVRVRKHYVSGPQGVRGRNSDNSRLRRVLDWEPRISLEEGLSRTYSWIEQQIRHAIADGGEFR
jgi:nucleoside-diphosphate-sugar epimerase